MRPHLKNKNEQTEKIVLFIYFNKTTRAIILQILLLLPLEKLFILIPFPFSLSIIKEEFLCVLAVVSQ